MTSTTTYVYGTTGCIHLTGGNDYMVADIHVPEGSTLKYLRLYYVDTNVSLSASGFLTNYAPGQSTNDLVPVSSSGNGGYSFAVSNEITRTVNSSTFAYSVLGLSGAIDSTVRICGLRVAYYLPPGPAIFLPLVRR